MDCPFCTRDDIKQRIIIRNKHVFVFPSNIPIVPGHLLICPIRHVSKFDDLTNIERNAMFKMILKMKPAMKKAFKAEGFNFAWNEGKVAGQSVHHFHLHMLPRKKGDTGITKYEPRKFLYRPKGNREKSTQEELMEVSRIIRNCLN